MMNSKILVCGGTGLVGTNLIKKLKQKNHQIVLLSTQKDKANQNDIFYWNPSENIIDTKAFEGVDVIINLSGQGIFEQSFSEKRKKELLLSRTEPLNLLRKTIIDNNFKVKTLISASAIGYYPNFCATLLNESSTKENTFISNLVQDWEKAALDFKDISNVLIFRIGIVLSEKGGFLKQLMTPIKLMLGAVPGSGKQMVSWIHIDDLCDMMIHGLEHQLNGIYNAVSPEPKTLNEITKKTAQLMGRAIILPNIPNFALNIIFGKERAQLILSDQQVSSEKIESTNFSFSFKNIDSALKNLIAP